MEIRFGNLFHLLETTFCRKISFSAPSENYFSRVEDFH